MSQNVLQSLKEPRDLFYREHQSERALELLKPQLANRKLSVEERRAITELVAMIYRSQKRFHDAGKLYQGIGDNFQSGYCDMLRGDLMSARNFWIKAVDDRPNHWCLTLFGMITGQLGSFPTTIQVRNHLESDIANLIAAQQFPLLDNLLSYAEFLSQVNVETYKFYGRALMNAGWVDKAGPFLVQAQKTLPNDPEIYFHLGQYAIMRGIPEDARVMLNQCLLISPTYYPAHELLKTLAN